MNDRHRDSYPQEVAITRIDLSIGNILVLALKFGLVWLILGFLGALVWSVVS